ncbi:MAG: sigma 54-interacting transcriptional regulator [Candidatus Zixiibacteriota bacterium]
MIKSAPEYSEEISRAVHSHFNAVIEGESGVGKQYLAGLIHRERRWGGEFVVFDCQGTPKEQTNVVEQLLSPPFLGQPAGKNTLFIRRIDLLEGYLLARFCDSLGELSSRKTLPRSQLLNLGLIGSLLTAEDDKYEDRIQLHRLLNSLFCLKIRILPLRERKRDLPRLVETFISLFNKEQKRQIRGITGEALGVLSRYAWPDNVRQLRMEIERAVTLTGDGEVIQPSALSHNLVEWVSNVRLVR